ncbi:MAG: amidohydrolase family protein [Thermomicrobiales bacterium]
MNDLARHIQTIRLIDTHEHLRKELEYVEQGPDILQSLFGNYVTADLVVAGASPEAVDRLVGGADPDVRGRFAAVRAAWEACQHTGYGEAVRLIARLVYDLEELTPEGLEAANARNAELRRPGERLRLLRDVAGLDHVQIDDFVWPSPPDASGPDFFLYDLTWAGFCNGQVDPMAIHAEVGIAVEDLASLGRAIETLFAKHGPTSIAVKAQHAYNRTLLWRERTDAEAEAVLRKQLAGQELDEAERLCLGDWCWARGVERAIEHNLPFKIHTGYYAGHSRMPVERIRSGHLCALLARYPQARFVLMHIAYPYSNELVALAKHYPNVYVDLCWAWSIDPYTTRDFVRRAIHAVPANKLFAFGGDTGWPAAVVGYTAQARQWLTRALQAEVDEGLLSERQAIALATRLMRTNQEECFDLAGTRAAIHRAMGA